jgi:hypothetical protein
MLEKDRNKISFDKDKHSETLGSEPKVMGMKDKVSPNNTLLFLLEKFTLLTFLLMLK